MEVSLTGWVWSDGGFYRNYETVTAHVSSIETGWWDVLLTSVNPHWEQAIGTWDNFGLAIDEAECAARNADEMGDDDDPDADYEDAYAREAEGLYDA